MSVLKSMEKYNDSDDHDFKARCTIVKEQRAEEVKHHLWVLWTDFFKPHHLEADASIHELMWNATKVAGEAKKTNDIAKGQELIDLIDQISDKFWATAEGPRRRRLRPVDSQTPATTRGPSPPAGRSLILSFGWSTQVLNRWLGPGRLAASTPNRRLRRFVPKENWQPLAQSAGESAEAI